MLFMASVVTKSIWIRAKPVGAESWIIPTEAPNGPKVAMIARSIRLWRLPVRDPLVSRGRRAIKAPVTANGQNFLKDNPPLRMRNDGGQPYTLRLKDLRA